VSIGKRVATAILLASIAATLGAGTWRGAGFRRDGPEMLILKRLSRFVLGSRAPRFGT
jgi:hypothetical protein